MPPSIVALNRGGVCQMPFLACLFVTDLVDRRSLSVELPVRLRESEVRERRRRRASTCHLGAWCRHRLRAAPNRCLRLPCDCAPLPVCVMPCVAPEIRRIAAYNIAFMGTTFTRPSPEDKTETETETENTTAPTSGSASTDEASSTTR